MTGTIDIDADNNLTAKKQRKSLGKPDGKRTYQKHESLDKYIEKKAFGMSRDSFFLFINIQLIKYSITVQSHRLPHRLKTYTVHTV